MLGLLLIAQSCSFLAHPKQETVFWAERAWKKSGGCPVLSLFSLLFLLFALVQENKNENSTMLQDKLPPERSTCMWPVDISSIYSCDAAGPGDLDQQLVRCRLPLSGPWRDRVSPAGARMLLSFSSIMATPGTTHCSTAERSVIEYGVNLFAVLAKQIIDTHTFVVGQCHWSLRLLLLARLIQTVPNFQWCRTLLSSSSGVNQLTSCSSVFSYNWVSLFLDKVTPNWAAASLAVLCTLQ